MRRRKSDQKFWFVVVLSLAILIFTIINALRNPDFIKMSLYNVLTLYIAIIIAYYFSQSKNDERKRKEKLEEIISKIQSSVTSEEAYITEETTKDEITMFQRNLSQKITVLSSFAIKYKIEEETKYIYDRFYEYKDFIGDHLTDMPFLQKSRIDLKKWLDLIDNKCDEIKLKLYQ